MNKSMIIGSLVGAAIVTAGTVGALALNKSGGPLYADVLQVRPVMVTVRTPRQACHDELVTHQEQPKDEHRIAGTAIGAVIGGVAGNQVGGGSGKKIATVVGAAAGGYAGNQVQGKMQENNTYQTNESRCETLYDVSSHTAGYDVTYEFEKEQKTVRMDEDPGKRLELDADGNVVVEKSPEPDA